MQCFMIVRVRIAFGVLTPATIKIRLHWSPPADPQQDLLLANFIDSDLQKKRFLSPIFKIEILRLEEYDCAFRQYVIFILLAISNNDYDQLVQLPR
jgi:hypothetical protein